MIDTKTGSSDASRSRAAISFSAIARITFGTVLALVGLTLVAGGVWLGYLGGSLYYAIVGVLLLASGIAFCLGRPLGFYIYAAAFIFTLLWSLWEVGLDGWALTPRLTGPLILMALALLLFPSVAIANAEAKRVRNLGLASLAAVMVLLGIGISMSASQAVAMSLPLQQASLAFDDPTNAAVNGEWGAYGAGASAQRYSNSSQINLANVKDLKRAWVFHAGGLNEKWGTEMTPLKVGNRLYGCNGLNVMFALDPATGQRIWSHDPRVGKNYIPYTAACRGVAFYKVPNAAPNQPCAERVIEGTLDMRLIAVDAATGKACADFGRNGQANLQVGLGQKDSINAKPGPMIPGTASITATPVIVQGVIVTGQEVLDGQRRWAPSGVIRGYDAVSGQLRFAWDVNRPDVTKDPPPGGYYSFGTPNSWTAPVGDEKLGLAYIPMGNSAGDYYTSLRSAAENGVNSSIVALDVKTGKPRWMFQTVHKDVWDYDIGSQPSLVEFPVGGRRIPALIVPSKQGEIYVLDRATGRSLQPVEERPVPQGGVEPAQRSPTQPYSTYHTLAKANLTEKDMWGLSPIDQMMCRIQFRRARYEGRYTPPELNRHTIEWPGYNGGSDWGSVAIDPRRGVIIANYNDTSNSNMLVSRQKADQLGLFPAGDPRAAHSSSSAEGAGAMEGTPYAILVNAGWVMPTGVLCTQPPYGGIRAIDLVSGKTIWDRPLGTARANGPFGIPSMMPFNIGTPNNGGSAITASGLVFVAAATDNLIRAIDMRTGKTVWSDVLPGGGQANPMIYEQNGKEYLVIMAGGHHFMKTPQSDALVAYALP
ncbi:MAG TPA: membrane-bound PQQ-dependent dehydrogenase, glucose/quinate/shikimate family [Sphingomicrobium sp.]|nr:membrane-bound PQQ-dependent dehydrogenase, glucose/quinate/shikimate family [Sphingomicrobium sp.]